jgi:hypothetical protein
MRLRGKARQHSASAPRTRAQMRACAVHLINFCTPERFSALTADEVARHSGLSVEKAAALLAEARRARAV